MIDAIINEIQNLPADIKAEAIASQLGARLDEKHLYVRMANASRRSFSRDVFSAEKTVLSNNQEALQLNITRSALYDLLPEGIFFQPPAQNAKKQSAAEMAEEYRINQTKEKKIRNFFTPAEQEFFNYRCKTYKAYGNLLENLEGGLLDEYLVKFWNLHSKIPRSAAIRMILLMPFIHQIAGDSELMAKALHAIIREPVTCRGYYVWEQNANTNSNVLGQMLLGYSSTCDMFFLEDDYIFDFRIAFSEEKKIQQYIEGGSYYFLLQSFYQYFVPANAGHKTSLVFNNNNNQWMLGDEAMHHLGISSVI